MTFAKNRAYGVPEFAGTEVNQHFGNLKGRHGVPANISQMAQGPRSSPPHLSQKPPPHLIHCTYHLTNAPTNPSNIQHMEGHRTQPPP